MVDWRPVEGWPHYDVSDCGDLREGSRGVGQWLNDQGYSLARLRGPRATVRVHRLVAVAFVPNPEDLPFVNHINNSRADNRAENLEWCTQAQNIAHADRQGRMNRNPWPGRRNPRAKLSDAQVRALRAEYAANKTPHSELAKRLRLSRSAVSRCIKGDNYADVR